MLIFLMCAVCPVVGISAALVIARVTNGEWPSRGPSGAARTIGASCAGCCALSWTDKSKRMRLHKIADVPEVMRRPGILGGYRLGLTNAECVRSFLTVTNEVANQWTHSLPMLWACWAAFSEWQLYTQGSISLMELGIAVAYFGTILFCFGSSVVFHTFGCKSGQVCWDLCHIDHVGVVLGTLAGYFPGLYYGYVCEPNILWLYTTLTGTVFASTMWLMASPKWRNDDWFWIRLGALGSLLFLGVVPSAHYITNHWNQPDLWVFTKYILEAYSIMITGVIFYLGRFPESVFPGVFDLMFHSHMWWHVCVAGGFLSMFYSTIDLRDYRRNVGCHMAGNHTMSDELHFMA